MPTNRDKINKMTNEELAEFLAQNECRYCVLDGVACYENENTDCYDGILQWLNKE